MNTSSDGRTEINPINTDGASERRTISAMTVRLQTVGRRRLSAMGGGLLCLALVTSASNAAGPRPASMGWVEDAGAYVAGDSYRDISRRPGQATATGSPVLSATDGKTAWLQSQPSQPLPFIDYQNEKVSTAWWNRDAFTMAAWVRLETSSFPDGAITMMSVGLNPDGRTTMQCSPGSGYTDHFNSAPTTVLNYVRPIPTNLWHHVVMTFQSGDKRIYIDGMQVAQSTVASQIDIVNGDFLRISGYQLGFQYFTGAMSHVGIYPYAMTPNAVGRLYSRQRQ